MELPTRSVRGGYVIIFFGLMILAYGILSGYGIWKAEHADDPGKYKDFIRTCLWSGIAATLAGLGLIMLGGKLARNVEDYDADDPDEPMMKF